MQRGDRTRHLASHGVCGSVQMLPCISIVMWETCTRSPFGGSSMIVECVCVLWRRQRCWQDVGRAQVPELAHSDMSWAL